MMKLILMEMGSLIIRMPSLMIQRNGLDTDNDGIGNNTDLDDDGDGISDVYEIQLVQIH